MIRPPAPEIFSRALADKNNNLVSRSKVRTVWYKLWGFKTFNIKRMIRNNFDLKPKILKLFYCSFIINAFLFGLSATANLFYTVIFFIDFTNIQWPDSGELNFPWIGVAIINALYFFFLIRMISDYYKLSLRSKYRNNYLKLLFLDIFLLNIFNLIGTLLFFKHKGELFEIKISSKINLNSQTTKDYSKLIFKVDMSMLSFNLIFFALALIIGYFVPNNIVKLICWVIFLFNMIELVGFTSFRMINIIIIQRMLINLLSNQDFYYLLGILRFMAFAGLGYYMAILIASLKFDEPLENNILDNW